MCINHLTDVNSCITSKTREVWECKASYKAVSDLHSHCSEPSLTYEVLTSCVSRLTYHITLLVYVCES
jgi:hypothetical protein